MGIRHQRSSSRPQPARHRQGPDSHQRLVVRQPSGPLPVGSAPTRALHGRRVLLIDDHRPLRDSLEKVLRSVGCTAVTADGPAAALSLFERRSDDFDAVVVDVELRGGSGRVLIDRLVELGYRGPVLYISGRAANLGRGAKEAVSTRCLQKPFRGSTMLEALEELLDISARPSSRPGL